MLVVSERWQSIAEAAGEDKINVPRDVEEVRPSGSAEVDSLSKIAFERRNVRTGKASP